MTTIEDWIIGIRREFHSEPELCFNEFQTQQRIMDTLHGMGIRAEKIAGTGVIATIKGRATGPCIALRADMDALEVSEVPTERNKSYISKNRGVMHACAHDGHMAMVLGAARLLQEQRNTFRGQVRLIFQPAEEQPPGGAIRVIEEDGLEGVDAILGMHIFTSIDAGTVGLHKGSLMASSNMFNVKIKGKGGHHSNPENCIDPILLASGFISSVRNRSVQACNREEQTNRFVIGFGKIEGGAQFNRTPDEVSILGSFRTFDDRDTRLIEEMMRETLDELMNSCTTENCDHTPSYDLEVLHGYPVLINDAVFTKATHSLLTNTFPQVNIDIDTPPVFGAEDFAFYLQKVPGTYVMLGNRNTAKGIVEGNHSNMFDIDEDILITGTRILECVALDFLERPEAYLP